MRNLLSPRLSTATRRHLSRLLLLSLLAVAALVTSRADAFEVASLYTVQIPIDPEDPASRNNAYQDALTQVLVRVTGSVGAAMSPEMADIFPNPSRYVLQYRPGEENTLWVSLDGPAIEAMLRSSGQTIWGSDRPLTLIWLAVDWGAGEREIVAADDPDRFGAAARSIDRNRLLRERVLDIATQRGLPVVFPLLDTEDLESISFSDIWGGFDDRLIEASARYGANAILVGRIRTGDFQPNRWTFYLGETQREWSGEPEEAINLLGDALAAEFAFAGDAPVESVTLSISGVDSLIAYGNVQRLMEELNQIEGYTLDTVAGDRLRFMVRLQGGSERLRKALEFSSMLIPLEETDYAIDAGALPEFDALEFVYSP